MVHFIYMGGVAQFGINQYKQGQKRSSQLQLSLNTDQVKICNFVCSSITAMRGFAKVICRDCDHREPKGTSNIDAYYTTI